MSLGHMKVKHASIEDILSYILEIILTAWRTGLSKEVEVGIRILIHSNIYKWRNWSHSMLIHTFSNVEAEYHLPFKKNTRGKKNPKIKNMISHLVRYKKLCVTNFILVTTVTGVTCQWNRTDPFTSAPVIPTQA